MRLAVRSGGTIVGLFYSSGLNKKHRESYDTEQNATASNNTAVVSVWTLGVGLQGR